MTYEELIGAIDDNYEKLCDASIHKCNFSAHDIEELKFSNRELHQALFFQDYLRLRSLATIQVYHDYLREKLLDVAQIDIGTLDESTS